MRRYDGFETASGSAVLDDIRCIVKRYLVADTNIEAFPIGSNDGRDHVPVRIDECFSNFRAEEPALCDTYRG